jgi:hypothetical protein
LAGLVDFDSGFDHSVMVTHIGGCAMARLALLVVSLTAWTACYRDNRLFCENPDNADDPICMEPMQGGGCKSSAECMDSRFPVCDLMENDGTCVVCTESDHQQCTGKAPICQNHTCVACVVDDDCGVKGVCLPEGDCAAENRIIHAKATGGFDDDNCGATGNECTLARAFAVVTADKDIIKLDDATTYTAPSGGFQVDKDVSFTLDARGAILRRSDDGAILSINEDGFVTILGGTISSARGNGSDGIVCRRGATLIIEGTTITNNGESAIEANECTLRIEKADITNNSTRTGQHSPAIRANSGSLTMWLSKLSSNRGGGVDITGNGNITIVGNLLSDNGEAGTDPSQVGGLDVETSTAPTNRLEFNTIVNNRRSPGQSQGVQCDPGTFIARNNIIWDTGVPAGPLITGSCRHAYSAIPALVPINDAGNNVMDDPMFESDFRVKVGSPVDGKADPATDVDGIAEFDLAGRKRPSGQADIGAYEVPAP